MKSLFKFFIFVFILGVIGAFLLSSEIFEIKNIHVTGNKTITEDEIIKLSNIQYKQNIFKLNTKKIIKGMFNHPKIKAVKIKRVLPSSITLDIIEREGVALIPYLGSYINIDEETVIIEVITLDDNIDLPIVSGITFKDFKLGEKLNTDKKDQLNNVMEVIKCLRSVKMTDIIETINVEDSSNIIITTSNNIRVYLGNDKLDYKISMAKAIVEDLTIENEIGIVDMRHEGNPIFKRD